MEIQDIEPHVVGTPPPYKGGRNWVFLKLTTRDGTVGWGECNWSEYRVNSLVGAVEDLERFIVGLDPFEFERVRERLYRSSHFLHAPGPVGAQIASAVEMACIDIAGKVTDRPAHDFLGGKVNDRLRSYTYLHYEWEPPQGPEVAAEAAEAYVDRGFTALKFDPLHSIAGMRRIGLEELEYAESIVAGIREAVGDKCDLLVGTHGQLPMQAAIRLARRIEPYDPQWLEEPVPPENISAMASVADSTTIPVATGERITTPHQFSEILDAGAAQILQPNVGLLGPLGARKVAGMAESKYIEIAPWMYCGPVAGAANLHVDAASPNFLIQEGIETWDGFHAEVLEKPIEWEDGDLVVPDRPGLGVVPDEDVLESREPNEIPLPVDRPHYSLEKNVEKLDSPDTV